MINLDKLQNNIEIINNAERRTRGAGFTRTYLELLLHEFELGDMGNKYLFIGESQQHINFVQREFISLLKQNNYYDDAMQLQTRHGVWTGGRDHFFMFTSVDHAISGFHILTGRTFNRVFLDVSDNKYQSIIHNQKWKDFYTHLQCTLSATDGDII